MFPRPPPPGDALLPAHLGCSPVALRRTRTSIFGEWNDDDYRFGSWRDPGSAASPHRLCGQLGARRTSPGT
ncbi:MAG: hypothetical protein M5U19_20275 [Microthrixaceae bacterium]|nr:hypothetical protein [Microthrixaceae bacterium]